MKIVIAAVFLMTSLTGCQDNDKRSCTIEGTQEPQSGGVVVCTRDERGQLHWERKGL